MEHFIDAAELPLDMRHYFVVDGETYHLQLNGGTWQLRNFNHFIDTGFSNSYKADEVVKELEGKWQR